MSIKSMAIKGNPLTANPISAYLEASKTGGDTTNAIFDPNEHILKWKADTPAESAAYIAKAKEKRKKMAKGGSTNCRGMGKATRGGGYR